MRQAAPRRALPPGQKGNAQSNVAGKHPNAPPADKATDTNQASMQRQVCEPAVATSCTQTLSRVFYSPLPSFVGAKSGPGRKYGGDDDDNDTHGVGLKDLPTGSWLPACSTLTLNKALSNTMVNRYLVKQKDLGDS